MELYSQMNNILISCACGCGNELYKFDCRGRPRTFINGHNTNNTNPNPFFNNGRILSWNGYIMIRKPDHPNCNNRGYVQEHRLVMEEFLNRYLESNEEIHHIDGNKQNNDINNLELTDRSSHAKYEMTLSWKTGKLRKC